MPNNYALDIVSTFRLYHGIFSHCDMLTTKSEIRYILHVSIPMYDCNVSREKLQFVYRKAINRIKPFSIEQPKKFESIFPFLAG